MAVRSGSGSGGQREGDSDAQQTGTPQPPSHRPLPRPISPPTEVVANDLASIASLFSALEPRLIGSLLKRRGVDRETAQDACQHAFAVFLAKRPAVESLEHAFNWLNLVAHRQVGKWQRHRRRVTADEVPDQAVPDVAESVESSLLLAATAEAFAELRPRDRESLLRAAEGHEREGNRLERNRVALVVHRARKRLRSKLDDWWALFPWAKWRQSVAELPAVFSPALGVKVLTSLVVGGAVLLPVRPDRVDTARPVVVGQAAVPHDVLGQTTHAAPVARTDPPRTAEGRRVSPLPREPEPPPAPQPGPLDNHRVEVESPATRRPVEVGTSTRQPEDDSLACWGNFPLVPDGCIQHPLYAEK